MIEPNEAPAVFGCAIICLAALRAPDEKRPVIMFAVLCLIIGVLL